MLQVVKHQTGKLDQLTERSIPVVWFGIAQEVRLMGDFDNWTQGFSLSAEEFSDGTFTRFQGDIKLVPVRPFIIWLDYMCCLADTVQMLPVR